MPHKTNVIEWFRNRLPGLISRHKAMALEDLQVAYDAIQTLQEWLEEVFPIGPQVIPEMTYEQAITYFVEERPSSPKVAKGAMLLQKHSEGRVLIQVFLDERNDIVCYPTGKPYGRRLIVHRLDSELKRIFNGKDLVIVE
jgi:hypothetical protein